MDKTELLNIITQHLESASSEYYNELSSDREKALEYYYQQPFGNECEGRSAVVTSEVADTINWMLPSLMRTFTSSENIAVFDPSGPEDEDAARQQTDYINHVFYKECDGFKVLHDWFQDALLLKNGIVKVHYVEDKVVEKIDYNNLTEQEFMLLASDEEITVDNYDIDEETGLIAAEMTRTIDKGRPAVDVLPPEEFFVDPDYEHLSLDETPFCCHETVKTRSELIEAGFPKDLIEGLSTYYDYDADEVTEARKSDLGAYEDTSGGTSDTSQDNILVSDCYLHVDFDGDGIAETRRVVVLNRSDIAYNDETSCNPFVSITPIPVAHRFYGRSIADQTMDLQLQKSTLLRNILDNLYLTNNQEKIVLDGGANLDDLLTSQPGGIKREYIANAIRPMPVTPFTGHPYQMLEYFDDMKENRTGVTKYNQGMDSESLNQTATGVNKIMNASQSRMDLVSRLFADGIKNLMLKLHGVLLRNQDKEKIVKLRGQYVPVNPSEWEDRTQMTVNVGLGTSDPQQQLGSLQMVLGMQMQAMSTGMSNPVLIYNTFTKIVEAAGLKTPELYFTPPQQMPPQQQGQQPPDPQSQALIMNAQAQMQKNQIQQEENQMDFMTEQQKLNLEARKIAVEEYKAGLEEMKITGDMHINQQKMNEEIARDVNEMLHKEREMTQQQQQIPQNAGQVQ